MNHFLSEMPILIISVLPVACCQRQLRLNGELVYQVGWSLPVSVLPDFCNIKLAAFKFSSTSGLLSTFHVDGGVE
jgi:hypothetical protein